MNYKIFENSDLVNIIVADEDFVTAYCEKMGYTFEAVPKAPEEDKIDTTPSTEARVAALEAENHLLKEQVGALTERNGFHEDLIAEMASVVYG